MAKTDVIFSGLQKLYAQRSAVAKQIIDAQKKLSAEASKPAPKKPAAKKPAKKKPAKKPQPKK